MEAPSDDAIRQAVASERSWPGAARALGLRSVNGGAMRTLKKRAAALGVDVSHFTHQRTWSDDDLKQAVAMATSWSEVLRALGLSERDRASAKRGASALGLDVSHLDSVRGERPAELDAFEPRRESVPAAAEGFAAAWFAIRGLPVAVPTQPAAYDLLVTFATGVRRVQVKTTTFRAKHGSWSAIVGRRPYALDKSAGKVPYDPDELDYFFIIDGDAVVYLIPSFVLSGRTRINVGAYRQFIVGDASSLFATNASA